MDLRTRLAAFAGNISAVAIKSSAHAVIIGRRGDGCGGDVGGLGRGSGSTTQLLRFIDL